MNDTVAKLKAKLRYKDKQIEQLESCSYSGKFRVLVIENEGIYLFRIYTNSYEEAEVLFDIMRKNYSNHNIYLSELVKDSKSEIKTFKDLKFYEKRWNRVKQKYVMVFYKSAKSKEMA